MNKPDYHTTVISGGNILLRSIKPNDVDSLYGAVIASKGELRQWMHWCHKEYNISNSKNWCDVQEAMWNDGVEYSFAITDKATGAYLGGCGINRIDWVFKSANLGYWVRSDWAGKNLATRATVLLAAWGFETLALNRIEIIPSVRNPASIRVAEKVGAKREGVMRSRLEFNSVIHDAVLFSLIPKDLK